MPRDSGGEGLGMRGLKLSPNNALTLECCQDFVFAGPALLNRGDICQRRFGNAGQRVLGEKGLMASNHHVRKG